MSIFVVIRLMFEAVIITQAPNFQGWLHAGKQRTQRKSVCFLSSLRAASNYIRS